MDSTNDASTTNGGVERARKGRWKRAQQVCTNCRQMKLRCDFQERFPEPCTRCASSGHTRGMPCHVDPSFRRVTKRNSDGPSASVSSSTQNGQKEPELPPIPLGSRALLPAPRNEDADTPTSTLSDISTQSGRTLGSVHVTGEEIAGCFHEFLTYYHPFLPIILHPTTPDETFTQSHYLFWAAISIGARPRPDHPVARARSHDLCVEIGKEVRTLFSQMLLEPCRNFRLVQALVLVCEFPFALPQGREDFIWMYSGMAITIGTQLGLHRPKFASEYASVDEGDRRIEHEEIRERVLTWMQCFNVHQGLASFRGFPGLMADDWVLVKAGTKPIEDLCSRIFDLPDVFRTLRIHRLVRRLSLAVGNDPHTPSGQTSPEARGPLLAVFAAELADLEASLKPTGVGPNWGEKCHGPPPPLAPVVAVRLLEAKLQLYTFELQDEAASASPEDLLICYTSSIRIVNILAELHKSPQTRAIYWPRSIYGAFVAAILCLLKLAGLQVLAPRKMQIDRSVILKEITVAYDIMKMRSICPGDTADRRARGIQFLCSRLQEGTLPPAPTKPGVSVRSRMSLGGLLYDSIRQIKAMRAANHPGVTATFPQRMLPLLDAPIGNGDSNGNGGGDPSHDHSHDSTRAETQIAGMPAAQAPIAGSAVGSSPGSSETASEPSSQQAVYGFSQNGQVPNAQMQNGWDPNVLDMSNLPPIDSPEWLQLLSVENCAEIMSVPGYDASMMIPWDTPDVMMADPFNLTSPFG